MPVPRTLGAGLLGGLFLAMVTSAGIVAQRLSPGNLRVATIAEAVSAGAAIGVLVLTLRSSIAKPATPPCSMAGAHAIGAVLGVIAVHLVLRATPVVSTPWLSERPPQLVNDLVAVFGALALIWGSTRARVGGVASATALLLAVAYSVTAPRWHLDTPPGIHEAATIQLGVLVQLACTAVGVATLRRGVLGRSGVS